MSVNFRNLGTPLEFWEYFENISKIPHCSGNEGMVREYIKNEAEKFNFETKIDKAGNILVIIPPKKEKKSIIIIQSHIDMVCEKNKEVMHDFSKDPLKLKTITLDGKKWLTAEGTTLGADNATGMAYSLAIMKKIHNGELIFEDLEIDLLFTVNEEEGLLGAFQIDKELIRGKYLISLDSGRDNSVVIGSVGAMQTIIELKTETIGKNQLNNDFEPVEIKVEGFLGGHSGVDINKGRANALKLIAKILWNLNKKFTIFIKAINGGERAANAIPREAYAILYVKKSELTDIKRFLDLIISEIKDVFSNIEKDMHISTESVKSNIEDLVFAKEFQDKILRILYLLPYGPIIMHPEITNLVHTSTNFASMRTKKRKINILTMQRCFRKSGMDETSDKIIELFKLAGLKVKYKRLGGIGMWSPNFNSILLNLSKQVYKELFKEELEVLAVHGTLETGIFKTNFPDLGMIAIGPNQEFAHSPDERLDIQSVEKFWNFLIHILKNVEKE